MSGSQAIIEVPKAVTKADVVRVTIRREEEKDSKVKVKLVASSAKTPFFLISEPAVGGRLHGFQNAWWHNPWVFRVVSLGLTWG